MSMKELVGELAKESARMVLPFPVAAVFAYLIDEVVKDKGEIERIDQKLAKLQQLVEQQGRLIEQQMLNHYKAGTIYLSEAQNAFGIESQKAYVHEYLHDAQKEFTEATLIELPEYPLIPIKGNFYVGVCHDLSQDRGGALSWYQKAHDLVVAYLKTVRPPAYDAAELTQLERELSLLNSYKRTLVAYFSFNRTSVLSLERYPRTTDVVHWEDPMELKGHTYRLKRTSLLGVSILEPDPLVYDDVGKKQVHLTQLWQQERDWIVNRIREIKNSVEPVDYLLNLDGFDRQAREPYLGELQKAGYFDKWKMGKEEALDAVTWALSLTYLIATRRPEALASSK